jgi:hypothetical protein
MAWKTFVEKLWEGEEEFTTMTAESAAEEMQMGVENTVEKDGDPGPDPNAENMDEDSGNSDHAEDFPTSIFNILEAPRDVLENISNIAALRLVNDLAIRPAPQPPAGTARIKPPHRLIDQGGWQEIYTGKNVWIYDARSNVDQTVRVVSQASSDSTYGTAT